MVASGLYMPEAGRIFVRGRQVAFTGPADAISCGIGMVHQEFKLVRPFTVAENVLLANWRGRFAAGLREVEKQIRRQADELNFDLDPRRRIDELSIAERQRVEIIKVLLAGAEILILDEPTAVLIHREAARLLTTIRQLAAQGTSVVLVTHKLHEIRAFTDRVTVMRNGRTVAELPSRTTTVDELARLTVGSAVVPPRRASAIPGPCRLRVEGLHAVRVDGRVTVFDASFEVRAGEIYGIAGVGGNGQTELVDALTGLGRRPQGRSP